MKPQDENAKDPNWPADRPDQSGTRGFGPQLAGHAKANHSHTSSFDAGPPDYTLPGYPSGKETAPPGKPEKREPTTSAAARVLKAK